MKFLTQENRQALFCLYLYLAPKGTPPANGAPLGEIIAELARTDQQDWKESHRRQLAILQGALTQWPILGQAVIGHQIHSEKGLTACSFFQPEEPLSVVFRGTGKEEWMDNGRGLSGIPEPNTYLSFQPERQSLILQDQATESQVEALNWFNRIAETEGCPPKSVILSGHSKGGNKAQFIALHTDRALCCYSFDGQGFSPEALAAFQRRIPEYEERRHTLFSLSADNDYINVFGKRLMPPENIFFLQASEPRPSGYHAPEALFHRDGTLRPRGEQGALSRYLERVSEGLLELPPRTRRHATRAVMTLCQRFIGNAPADGMPPDQLVVGLGLALGLLFFPGGLDKPGQL